MNRGFVKGEASKNIETHTVGFIDKETEKMCRISYSKGGIHIPANINTTSYISLEGISQPTHHDHSLIWSNKEGDIHIKKPTKESLNLYNTITPQGYSKVNDTIHLNDSNLGAIGQGSIQFKKSEVEFGASSELQFDYGTNTLLVSNMAPFDKSASMNFKVYDTKNVLQNVMTFQQNNDIYSDFNTEYECKYTNVTINLDKTPIRNCSFLGFNGSQNNNYIRPVNDAKGCVYTTGGQGSFPFDTPGNVIIQPNYQNGCIVFPTASEQENFKETMVIKDKLVSINPSRTSHKTFIEFDAQDDTRRVNIHGQENDTGIWSLVHTSEQNLEFQYYENEEKITSKTPTQILTLQKETKNKAFSYVNRNLCFYNDNIDSTLFRKQLNNSIIYIHHNITHYALSNSSVFHEYGIYEFTNRHLFFQFADTPNCIAFKVSQEIDFQSVIGMEFSNNLYIANQSSFSFIMNVNFVDVFFDNEHENSQQNLISFTNADTYTSYANGVSGFLASATGNFKNQANLSDINLVNLDEALPVVRKCYSNSDSTVVGVIGRIEKNENFVQRPYFWGAFGTTLYDRDEPRVVVASSGFVGMWVVVVNDNDEKIEYNTGDLLTSHSSGAAIKQGDDIIRSYTIGKLCVDSSFDQDNTESTSQYTTGDGYVLELKSVSLLLS